MGGANLSLSEWAVLTWKRDRPIKKAARLELRARYLQAVRRKLTEICGPNYEIKTGLDKDGGVTAQVDDVRFGTYIYNEQVITIIPVVRCPSCERDVYLGAVEDLAELGEALEEFSVGLRHECR
jgi:hypothetical protein